ncbi:hypothetical protein GCK32_022902 [Trichostrongylus colubriformis]|uniref:Phlebovirus glycoprotein G2 fusion domain-containing protein n=1 Tax=Trichostrongylus colubriformis TaxID=6319 RepID=A0AAN8G3A3_TRICO
MNAHFCDCDVSGNRPRCHCPHNNLSQLRRNPDYVLPIYKPRVTLLGVNGSVESETTEDEFTVAISSTLDLDKATLSISEPCVLNIGPLQGCYSCTEGSQASVSCFTLSSSWTTIKCDRYVFSVECNPHNKSTLLHLPFNDAVVDHECYTTCGGKNVSARLQGILYYHPHADFSSIALVNTSEVLPQLDWFDEFSLPDLSPLWVVAVGHWKSTLFILGAVVSVLVPTYFLGPIAIRLLFKGLWLVLKNVFTIALTAVRFLAKLGDLRSTDDTSAALPSSGPQMHHCVTRL